MAPKRYVQLEPVKVTLFAEVIKDLKMRSSRARVGLQCNNKCLYKRIDTREEDTQEDSHEDKGRDWSDVSTGLRTPRVAGNHQELERGP